MFGSVYFHQVSCTEPRCRRLPLWSSIVDGFPHRFVEMAQDYIQGAATSPKGSQGSEHETPHLGKVACYHPVCNLICVSCSAGRGAGGVVSVELGHGYKPGVSCQSDQSSERRDTL